MIPARVKTKMKSAGLRKINQAQRLNDSSHKSHHVMASEGGKYKYIKFGDERYETNQSKEQRAAFRARHRQNIARGKMSAAYWANKVKWKGSV